MSIDTLELERKLHISTLAVRLAELINSFGEITEKQALDFNDKMTTHSTTLTKVLFSVLTDVKIPVGAENDKEIQSVMKEFSESVFTFTINHYIKIYKLNKYKHHGINNNIMNAVSACNEVRTWRQQAKDPRQLHCRRTDIDNVCYMLVCHLIGEYENNVNVPNVMNILQVEDISVSEMFAIGFNYNTKTHLDIIENLKCYKTLKDLYPVHFIGKHIRIVCAANMYEDGRLLVGPRHWDPIMGVQAKALGVPDNDTEMPEEGFIDSNGKFWNRHDSHIIATRNDQIQFRCGGDTIELYSENIC